MTTKSNKTSQKITNEGRNVNGLIKEYEGLVGVVLKKWPFLDYDEAFSAGLQGLWDGCVAYRPEKGDIKPFLIACVTNAVRRFARDNHQKHISAAEGDGISSTAIVVSQRDYSHADLKSWQAGRKAGDRAEAINEAVEALAGEGRCLEVAEMMRDGYTHREIRKRLGISQKAFYVIMGHLRKALDGK